MTNLLKYRSNLITLVALVMFALLVAAGIASCRKDGSASPTGLNTQLNIINVSPDVLWLEYWANLVRGNNKLFKYPTPSNYIFLNALDNQLQLRRERKSVAVFDSTPVLKANTRYSLFVYGLQSNNTLRHIFIADTSSLPSLGRGKVRFINAISRAASLDVTANGTIAFKAQAMGKVSDFIEMPAGMYNFRVLSAGTTDILYELPNTTIQDGRLYTFYTYGVVGRTDSARLSASVISNR